MEANRKDDDEAEAVRSDLIERLRSLEAGSASQSELIFKRAQEALAEAESIRNQAIEDARQTRERELGSLLESMRALREAAEAQVETVVRQAETQAERLRQQASVEAQSTTERARSEAAVIRAQALAILAAAERRADEIDRIEAEFNRLLTDVVERLGLTRKRGKGWRKRDR